MMEKIKLNGCRTGMESPVKKLCAGFVPYLECMAGTEVPQCYNSSQPHPNFLPPLHQVTDRAVW
jgi:hypothetical protein